jgi:fatty acid synthase subunit alpha
LYAESKIGLETLYYKWSSEGWSDRIGLVGAEIGWTKGTGLMSSNDLVAERMESQAGLRTFESTEMAFNLTALMTEPVVALARQAPLHSNCMRHAEFRQRTRRWSRVRRASRPCTSTRNATACVH